MDDDLHSDIRGVAVPGVEGEPVNLTEPVAEAIAAAFAGWLVAKKKADGSQRLRVSIGHDSRISAQILQVSFLNILVPFGYATSPSVST
jgi:phosphomannomutase